MEEYDGAVRGGLERELGLEGVGSITAGSQRPCVLCLDVVHHALEVETLGGRIVVAVLLPLESGVLKDILVVGPCGSGDDHFSTGRHVPLEEVRCHAKATSAREHLTRAS